MDTRLLRSTLIGVLVAAVGGVPLACGSSNAEELFGGGVFPILDAGGVKDSGAGGEAGAGGTDDSGGAGGGSGEGGSGGTGGDLDATIETSPESSTVDGGCDFTGTWAVSVAIPASWPATIVLLPGQGTIDVLLLASFTQSGSTISGLLTPCRIALPDFQSNLVGFFEKYGIRFPTPMFDGTGIVPQTVVSHLAGTSPGDTFVTDPVPLLIGLTMGSPTTDAWPDSAHTAATDDDFDNNPGVTTQPASGPGYYPPPLDATKFARADALYIVTRTVTTISGTVKSCDEMNGTTDILILNNKPAIDSHVVGCHVAGSGNCNPGQAGFVDTNQPAFTPAPGATAKLVRVATGATCQNARTMFP